jgi:hypothetical protein
VLADIDAPASLDDAERNALLDAYETAFLDESASEIERRARYYLES